jgi:NitT/TauT family transport system permease protein
MRNLFPVLTMLGLICAFWYAATIWLNAQWVYDQAERAGATVSFAEMVPQTMDQERPLLPPPHQVAAELWDGVAGQAITSKRSLVYHGFKTLQATLLGFGMGIALGVGLAVAIVYSRTMEKSVMPWAIISQTIPIVALAPMIIVLSDKAGIDGKMIPKGIIACYLSFFPVLVGMVKGLRSPDGMQLDLLSTYSASGAQNFWKLRLPASMPYFFASLKVAIAAALVGAIVGELPSGATEGLGARMLVGSQFGRPLDMWAALFGAAILAGGLILVVGMLERALRRRMGVSQ